MEGYATQDDRHGAVQGPTQDTEQYSDADRPGATGKPTGEPHPEAPSPASAQPGEPAPDGGETGPDSQMENAATSLDEPSDGSGGE
jgi:hypothetical protein